MQPQSCSLSKNADFRYHANLLPWKFLNKLAHDQCSSKTRVQYNVNGQNTVIFRTFLFVCSIWWPALWGSQPLSSRVISNTFLLESKCYLYFMRIQNLTWPGLSRLGLTRLGLACTPHFGIQQATCVFWRMPKNNLVISFIIYFNFYSTCKPNRTSRKLALAFHWPLEEERKKR